MGAPRPGNRSHDRSGRQFTPSRKAECKLAIDLGNSHMTTQVVIAPASAGRARSMPSSSLRLPATRPGSPVAPSSPIRAGVCGAMVFVRQNVVDCGSICRLREQAWDQPGQDSVRHPALRPAVRRSASGQLSIPVGPHPLSRRRRRRRGAGGSGHPHRGRRPPGNSTRSGWERSIDGSTRRR